MQPTFRVLLLLVVSLFAQDVSAQVPGRSVDHVPILAEEIRSTSAADVHAVVAARRPDWLPEREPRGAVRSAGLLVYLDGALIGDVRALREIAADRVVRIEFMEPRTVRERFGERTRVGGILVATVEETEFGTAPLRTDWDRRDADDYLSLQLSRGSLRLGSSEPARGEFTRNATTHAAVAIPLRPDSFLRLTFMRHRTDLTSGPGGEPRSLSTALSWASVEWKGQMPGTDRATPYVAGGPTVHHHTGDLDRRLGLGWVVGAGVDLRLVGPLHGFVEASHTRSRTGGETFSGHPVRTGVTLVVGGT
jgi:hypothetical protein